MQLGMLEVFLVLSRKSPRIPSSRSRLPLAGHLGGRDGPVLVGQVRSVPLSALLLEHGAQVHEDAQRLESHTTHPLGQARHGIHQGLVHDSRRDLLVAREREQLGDRLENRGRHRHSGVTHAARQGDAHVVGNAQLERRILARHEAPRADHRFLLSRRRRRENGLILGGLARKKLFRQFIALHIYEMQLCGLRVLLLVLSRRPLLFLSIRSRLWIFGQIGGRDDAVLLRQIVRCAQLHALHLAHDAEVLEGRVAHFGCELVLQRVGGRRAPEECLDL
mmetsp:Transcript_54952/g.125086  ORF Transcript_54952/g.125086 Transcript_54952/m.125086 type:complete len:277 (+) Transcript_54952:2284-3114(+)